jgi:hypothetical protein
MQLCRDRCADLEVRRESRMNWGAIDSPLLNLQGAIALELKNEIQLASTLGTLKVKPAPLRNEFYGYRNSLSLCDP